MADSIILMVLALVVFGPRRLPQIGRQLGKLMYEFRKASNDFKFQMEEELRAAEEADRRKKEEERQRTLALNPPAETAATEGPAVINATESPYGDEGKYSEVVTSRPKPPAETELRIQPPSTGETVAAEQPYPAADPAIEAAQAAQPEATEETSLAGASEAGATEQVAAQQTAPATEAVSHNG